MENVFIGERVPNFSGLPTGRHDSCGTQYPKMLRDQGLRGAACGNELVDALGAVVEFVDQKQSHRMSERFEQVRSTVV